MAKAEAAPESTAAAGIPVPVQSGGRFEWLDAIRGIALLGVILVHTNEYAAATGTAIHGWLLHERLDSLMDRMIRVLVAEKAQTLFTIMFGISFAIQIGRLSSSTQPDSAKWIYLRRLSGLLVIAAINMLALPTSDILNYYAVAGFVLLLTINWRLRSLIVVGLLLSLLAMPTQQILPSSFMRPAGLLPGEVVANIGLPKVYQSGSYGQIVLTHWDSLWFVDHVAYGLLGFLPYVLGRFLIGVALVRTGIVTRPQEHKRLLRQLLVFALPIGIMLSLSGWIARVFLGLGPEAKPAAGYLVQAGTLTTTFGYLAVLLLAWRSTLMQRLLAYCVPVGQMALTNYLLQAVFNSVVFFGFGLGFLGRLGAAACAALALVFFIFQCAMSRWWLRSHVHGPVEWAWRAWTYRRRPAWHRSGAAGVPSVEVDPAAATTDPRTERKS